MRVTIVRAQTFIPRWGKNRDFPAAQQITVEVKTPTVEERRQAVSTEISGDLKTDTEPSIEYRQDIPQLVRKFVTSIKNLEYEDEKKEVTKVTNGEELLAAPGLFNLTEEIGGHIAGLSAEPETLDPT